MQLWRFEVGPKPGLRDPAGAAATRSLAEFGIDVGAVRSSRLYLIEMAADRPAAARVLRELLVDPVSEAGEAWNASDPIAPPAGGIAFEVHYRPGVMDPAAASTAMALRDMGVQVQSVRTARRFVVPALPAADRQRVARWLANDCVEQVFVDRPSFSPPAAAPPHETGVRTVGLRALDDAALQKLSRDGHLFLSLPEMQAIRAEYRRLGREPTDLELETLAQTWSEHCVHKTLKSAVAYRGDPMPDFGGEARNTGPATERHYANLLKDTIARATDELIRDGRGPTCLSVFKDNAGIIAFDDRFGVAIKVETHNHPSAIEPYGGAATGLGGCIRDVIGCGLAAQPIASTDVFCVAPPNWPVAAVPRGALHPRQVLKGVVAGVRDYGNRMGIPTVNGAVHFDPRYVGNPLVFCGSIGLIPRDRIAKEVRPGDLIVVVGGRTGRDGIHGATFSSAELTDSHADEFSHAVQIGNAIEEKKLLDVILAARDYVGPDGTADRRCLYSAITDCGAGGLSSAIGEMGAETGAEVDLERVPLKYAGLRYDEIWISEAQERMVLAVPPQDADAFLALARSEDVEATIIGRFTDTHRLVVRFHGEQVGDVDMAFLHDGLPKLTRVAEWRAAAANNNNAKRAATNDGASAEALGAALLARLAEPTIASKEWIVRQYDHEVQGRSVLKPLVGRRHDGPGDAAVLRPRLDSNRGIAIGCGLAPQISDVDPYWMAWAAIDEAIRNVVCVGGDPKRIAILDNFCWGRPDDPRHMGALVRACQACYDAAKAYGTPFISGKDSLNNEFALDAADIDAVREAAARCGGTLPPDFIHDGRIAIPGTLLISALALVDDVSQCVSMDLKQDRGEIWLVGQAARFAGTGASSLPAFDPRVAVQTHAVVADLICRRLARAVHDVGDGGPLVACAEMALAGDRGCRVTGIRESTLRDPGGRTEFCFGLAPALYLVELNHDRQAAGLAALACIPATRFATLGELNEAGRPAFVIDAFEPGEREWRVPVAELRERWQAPLRW